MVPDSHTNQVYFSSKLKEPIYSEFLFKLTKEFKKNNVKISFLEGTNDIWCRDYMPVQVTKDKFVLFNYNPEYLKGYEDTITDNEAVCKSLGINYIKSSLKIDGGNIIRSENKVILTNKILKENENVDKTIILNELSDLFETDNIIIIPYIPYDKLGHADGIVRFLDDDNVLVCEFQNSNESPRFQNDLNRVLDKQGLNIIKIPYYPDYKKTPDGILTATGCYINYLQVDKHIFLPFFGNDKQDSEALVCFERVFGKNVYPVDSSVIASKGGVLNCISWNIYNNSVL